VEGDDGERQKTSLAALPGKTQQSRGVSVNYPNENKNDNIILLLLLLLFSPEHTCMSQ